MSVNHFSASLPSPALPDFPSALPDLKPPASGDDIVKRKGTGAFDDPKERQKLKKVCEDFETVFLNYTLQKMRETVPKDDLMGADHGEQIYRGMLDEELAKQMATSGGVGLASMLFRQLTLEDQAKTQPTPPVEAPGGAAGPADPMTRTPGEPKR